MSENVARSRGVAPGTGRKTRAHASALAAALVLVCLGMVSCAGDRYVRTWTYNGEDLNDTLTVGEDFFTLERVSSEGTEVFSGRFVAGPGPWRFEIENWKPVNGEERHFDPPIVFVCRGRLFENGMALFAGRFLGRAPMGLFIRTPTDFDRQD